MKNCFALVLLMFAVVGFAHADEGFCTGKWDSTYRHSDWVDYNAGGINVNTRDCLGKGNNDYTNIDVWNTQSMALCVEVVSDGKSGHQKWFYALQPDQVVSYSTRYPNTWRVGAVPLSQRKSCY